MTQNTQYTRVCVSPAIKLSVCCPQLQSHSPARLSFNDTTAAFSPVSVQPYFDGDYYAAYPGIGVRTSFQPQTLHFSRDGIGPHTESAATVDTNKSLKLVAVWSPTEICTFSSQTWLPTPSWRLSMAAAVLAMLH